MDTWDTDDTSIYVVEHLDPELGPWSALEYQAIADESQQHGVKLCLSSVSKDLQLPSELKEKQSLIIESQSVEELFKTSRERVCLLDPAAKAELRPEDRSIFHVFLFGGILGMRVAREKNEDIC